MMPVKELRGLATRLSSAEFRKQLGPFVLIQRPPGKSGKDTNKMGLPAAARQTQVISTDTMSAGALGLLFEFDDLLVASVPPLHGVDELVVGRQPDSDLVLDDPSVSKRHAVLRWDASNGRCSVQDQSSTNGTFLNASVKLKRETILRDGDILSFGDMQFWFLLTETLFEKFRKENKNIGV